MLVVLHPATTVLIPMTDPARVLLQGDGPRLHMDFFSQATNGFRERSHAKEPEVFDLCDDDDDEHHDPGNDTTITEHSEDEMIAQSAASSVRKRKPRAKPSPASSKESSLLRILQEKKVRRPPARRVAPPPSRLQLRILLLTVQRAMIKTRLTRKNLNLCIPTKKSRDSSRRTPNSSSSRGSSDVAYGSSDLYSWFR